jgi:hypothetical protein
MSAEGVPSGLIAIANNLSTATFPEVTFTDISLAILAVRACDGVLAADAIFHGDVNASPPTSNPSI